MPRIVKEALTCWNRDENLSGNRKMEGCPSMHMVDYLVGKESEVF